MAKQHEQSDEHNKAHDLAEEAIDKAAEGDIEKARELAAKAKKIDPKITGEMNREIEEDRRQAENFRKKQGDGDR